VSGPPREMDEAVTRALAHFDVDAVATTFVSARENTVYRVLARDGRSYALRVHRPGYHDLAELESENAWTTVLADAGVETPRPVPTRDGSGYATVPYGQDGDARYVGLIEWLDGEPLAGLVNRGDLDVVGVFGRLGELIARMHLSAFVPPPASRVTGLTSRGSSVTTRGGGRSGMSRSSRRTSSASYLMSASGSAAAWRCTGRGRRCSV
jgi:Ser/Thr protein kinase RdoA (MazF antagonist)